MIEVAGLTKSYQKGSLAIGVLDGVSFHVQAGEFVAIMGPSGSGKSTLLNMLGFLDCPDGGSVSMDGEDWAGADDERLSAIRNSKIGFVFQQFHLLERASALQNVMLPLLYADDDREDGEARATRALAAVGLAHRATHSPSELSGGEQQRVAIARALINDPVLILADEPTGNLDAKSGAEILGIFHELHRSGRTIVLITHDRDVAAHAERILTLHDGRITADERSSHVAAKAPLGSG